MSLKKTLFALLLLVAYSSFGQLVDDDWHEVGNSNYNANYKSIHYVSENVGYAVGSGGAYVKTTDGGFNWTAYDIGFSYNFERIVFTDSNNGFIFSTVRIGNFDNTVILQTTDGGETWRQYSETFYGGFRHAHFLPNYKVSHTAYLTLGTGLLKSENGGNSWEWACFDCYGFYSTEFFNKNNGLANFAFKLQSTSDGGQTWTDIIIPGFEQTISIFVLNDTVAYASSKDKFSYTTDMGLTWSTAVSVANTDDWFTNKMHFSSIEKGYRFDGNGKIWSTIDRGLNWTEVFNDNDIPVNSMFTRPSGRVDFVSSGGFVYSSDGINQFIPRKRGLISGLLHGAWFFNNNDGIAVGDKGTILTTNNSGNTWERVKSSLKDDILSVYFTSAQVGYIGSSGKIYKTNDGGDNWQESNTGIGHIPTNYVSFTSENVGYAAGARTYKTIDAGATWAEIDDRWSSKIHFANENTGYKVGSFGSVLKTTDSGSSWIDVSLDIANTFYAVHFLTTDIGFIAGSESKIYKTTNGGDTWVLAPNNTTEYYNFIDDILFVDDNIGYAVGNMGLLLKTEDGGDTWQQVSSNTLRRLKKLVASPGGSLFIFGQDGIVLRKMPSYILRFFVQDSNSNAIENAVITLNGIPYSAGQYIFKGLVPDTYTYSITKAGYSVVNGTVTIIDDDIKMNVTLEPRFKTTFAVTNSFNNQPLEAVLVDLKNVGQLHTNSMGIAVFENLETGKYKSEITSPHFFTEYPEFLIDNNDILIEVALNASIQVPNAYPAMEIGYERFTANWSESTDADFYLLFVSTDDFATHLPGYNGLELYATTHMLTSLTPGTTYKYRVKAANQYAHSDFSGIIEVETHMPVVEPTLIVPYTIITNTQSECYNATESITAGGPGNEFTVEPGGEALFIAGQTIRFLPGFHAQAGSYVHAHITTTGTFCSPGPVSSIVHVPPTVEKSIMFESAVEDPFLPLTEKQIKLYPNPNSGQFILQLQNFDNQVDISVYNLSGRLVHRSSSNTNIVEIEMHNSPRGMYNVHVTDGQTVKAMKMLIY